MTTKVPPVAILSMLLFLLATLATTLATSTPSAGLFSITSFLNSGSPHSLYATLSFTLSTPCTSPLANISCTYTQPILPTIATTTNTIPCQNENDTNVLFNFEYSSAGNGYYLSILHLSNENRTVDTGLLYMGANVTTVVDEVNPNGDFQMLVHESDFEVGFDRVEGCF